LWGNGGMADHETDDETHGANHSQNGSRRLGVVSASSGAHLAGSAAFPLQRCAGFSTVGRERRSGRGVCAVEDEAECSLTPAMINVDLSKGLHPRFMDLFPAFMPGLFFEISIFLACPRQIQNHLAPAHLERFPQIIIALILAFIIGSAFMCWVRVLQMVLRFVLRVSNQIRRKLWMKLLDYFLNARRFPPPPMPGSIRRFLYGAQIRARSVPPALVGLQAAWGKAAVQLLKRRYGIDPPRAIGGDDEWRAWQSVLGMPKANTYRGIVLVQAIHATGWSALAAARLVPALRNSAYLTLSEFLILYGIMVILLELRRWTNPSSVWSIALYSVLDEIPQINGEKKDQHQDEGDIVGPAE
jgi:hypothetical protein